MSSLQMALGVPSGTCWQSSGHVNISSAVENSECEVHFQQHLEKIIHDPVASLPAESDAHGESGVPDGAVNASEA